MSDSRKHLRVFVASPGDVAAERRAAAKVVDEVNRLIGESLAVHLDSWLWEVDALPGHGHPQDVVNRELDSADVVVVILWQRIGTPTANARSGTFEEVERALARAQANDGRPHVMVYYSNRPAPPARSRDELRQREGVLDFHDRFDTRVLAQSFDDTDAFTARLRKDLTVVARELASTAAGDAVVSAPASFERERYLADLERAHRWVVLTGLVQDRSAANIDLESVYVPLIANRPRSGDGSRQEALGDHGGDSTVAALGELLSKHRKTDAANADLTQPARDAIEAALRAVGAGEEMATDPVSIASLWNRLLALVDLSSTAVRDVVATVELDEAFRWQRHLLIEGDPGSGKTTTLKHIALTLARAHGDDATAARALGIDPSSCPLPIVVPLRRFWTWLAKLDPVRREYGSRLLLDYLHEAVEAPYGEGWLEPMLAAGDVCLLFDGLDEVGDPLLRDRTARALADFVARHDRCRYVLTSRPAGLDRGVRSHLTDLVHARVRELDQPLRERFIDAWYQGLMPGDDTARERARSLIAAIRRNQPVQQIATSPILLTAIAVVHQSNVELPDQRAALYESCVRALLERWDLTKDEEGRRLAGPLNVDQKVSLLQNIAEAIHLQGAEATSIEPGPLLRLVRERLPEAAEYGDEACHNLIAGLSERSGLIVSDENNGYRFRHHTFQEFLTARSICDRSDNPVAELDPVLDDPWWREVVLLAPAFKALHAKAEARRMLMELLNQATARKQPHRARAHALLAQALLDLRRFGVTGLDELIHRHASTWLDILGDRAQVVAVAGRIAVAQAFGCFGDPRLTEDNRWVEVPAGRFWRGSSAYPDEKPEGWVEVPAFGVQRWPVTVAQFRDFVDDGGYTSPDLWHDAGWEWREAEQVVAPSQWELQLDKRATHPVVGVSWHEAAAWCEWATRRQPPADGRVIRLPTEAEWEKAARGGERLAGGETNREPKRAYPWGDAFDATRCNGREGEEQVEETTPVGCYAAGHGPYGVWDQAGNVWEWCLDWFDAKAYTKRKEGRTPQDPAVLSDDEAPLVEVWDPKVGEYAKGRARSARGGGWVNGSRYLRVSYRVGGHPSFRGDYLGFRCVSAPPRALVSP